MKRLFLLMSIFLLCSCGMKLSAKDEAIRYLNKYKYLDAEIMKELDENVDNEDFTDEQKKQYKDILTKQYSDMRFDVVNEEYDDDQAIITVKVVVYDLYKVQEDANDYLNSHQDEFMTDGEYDKNLFLNYKLDKMEEQKDTIDYEINIELEKDDKGNWVVQQLSDEDLEKLHGIYEG